MPAFSLNPLAPFPPPGEDFPDGTQFQDEGTDVGPPTPPYVNFVGDGVVATFDEETNTVTVAVSGEVQSGAVGEATLQIQADDADVGADDTETLNFEGDVSVVDDGTGKRTVTINAGGGGTPLTVSQDDVVIEENVNLINVLGDAPLVTARSGAGAVDLALRSGGRSILLTGAQLFPSVGSNDAWADILMAPPGSGYTVDVTDWGNLPDNFWPTWTESGAFNYWTYDPAYVWLVTFGIRGTWLGGAGSLESTQFRAFVTATPTVQNPTIFPIAEHQRLYEGDAFAIGFAGILLPFGSEYLRLQILNPASGNTIQIDDVRTTFVPMSFSAPAQGEWP